MMTMFGGLGFLGMGFMWIWMLIPLGLILAVAWLGGRAARNGWPRSGDGEPEAILRRRLESGAITAQQYREARTALGLPEEP